MLAHLASFATAPAHQYYQPEPTSEDCLFLNVYTPALRLMAGNASKLLPVVVFLHGGSWSWGSGAAFDGG